MIRAKQQYSNNYNSHSEKERVPRIISHLLPLVNAPLSHHDD